MKIAIMGAGGVGGYFGAVLHRAGEEMWFVARGEHLRALRAKGLRVTSVLGDFTMEVSATDNPAEVRAADLVVFGVKSYDTQAAGKRLELDALAGAVVRFGKEIGVATPMNQAVYAALNPHDLKARGELVVR